MIFLNNYSKLIKAFLHFIVLVLAILAIIFTYTNQLFVGDETVIKDFAMWTYKPVDFSLLKLTDFSNTFIEYAYKDTQINDFITFKVYMVNAAKTMKVFVIVIIFLHAFFAMMQLFSFRAIGTFNLCLLNLFAIIFFIANGINGFEETKLITSYSQGYITIVVLWSIATFITFLELVYDYLIEKLGNKSKDEKKEECNA